MSTALTYAIGDIHGCFRKLADLLRHCREHAGTQDFRFVFLGDYVDRGAHSREVVTLLMERQASEPERYVCLMGNHEDMLVNAARGENELHWLDNGGDATLASYGVRRAQDIPPAHLAWFERLPLASRDERRFYVHAGIMPGEPLDTQRKEVLLWIRERFLLDPRDHGLFVVHGHTPTETGLPDLQPNRVNIDTRAWAGGPLTAAAFDDTTTGPPAFIRDDGRVTRVMRHETPRPSA
ncbi:MAG: metallophosphoesterase family protein [Xanthobacteraceae bacterium]